MDFAFSKRKNPPTPPPAKAVRSGDRLLRSSCLAAPVTGPAHATCRSCVPRCSPDTRHRTATTGSRALHPAACSGSPPPGRRGLATRCPKWHPSRTAGSRLISRTGRSDVPGWSRDVDADRKLTSRGAANNLDWFMSTGPNPKRQAMGLVWRPLFRSTGRPRKAPHQNTKSPAERGLEARVLALLRQ